MKYLLSAIALIINLFITPIFGQQVKKIDIFNNRTPNKGSDLKMAHSISKSTLGDILPLFLNNRLPIEILRKDTIVIWHNFQNWNDEISEVNVVRFICYDGIKSQVFEYWLSKDSLCNIGAYNDINRQKPLFNKLLKGDYKQLQSIVNKARRASLRLENVYYLFKKQKKNFQIDMVCIDDCIELYK